VEKYGNPLVAGVLLSSKHLKYFKFSISFLEMKLAGNIMQQFNTRVNKNMKIEHDKNKMNCELMLSYDTPALRQTGFI
jgi:hypothetical protein